MAQKNAMTRQQLEELKKKLEYLSKEGRDEVTERIAVARGHGDLSENSEYDEAMNDQSRLENDIAELKEVIDNVIIIDEESLSKDVISIGSKLEVELLLDGKGSGRKFTYHLVSSSSAMSKDDGASVIASDDSPVAMALVGHKVGDVIDVEAPRGMVQYKILAIL